jgi:hypothetical protein
MNEQFLEPGAELTARLGLVFCDWRRRLDLARDPRRFGAMLSLGLVVVTTPASTPGALVALGSPARAAVPRGLGNRASLRARALLRACTRFRGNRADTVPGVVVPCLDDNALRAAEKTTLFEEHMVRQPVPLHA